MSSQNPNVDSNLHGKDLGIQNSRQMEPRSFKDLTAYYADRAAEKRAFLQFWESIHTRTVSKTLTANLVLSYEGKDKEKKEFRDSKKITVQYEEQYVGLNYAVIIIILLLLSAIGYYVLIAVPASKERLKKELMDAMDQRNNRE